MTATNHALTGALIGLTVSNPLLALPAALLSHLICDMIPHFGPSRVWLTTSAFKVYLVCDAVLCIGLVVVLFSSNSPQWLLAAVCAFLATSPDLLWIRKFVNGLKGRAFRETKLEKLLARIQWFEKPIGIAVELAWFGSALLLLVPILYNV